VSKEDVEQSLPSPLQRSSFCPDRLALTLFAALIIRLERLPFFHVIAYERR